MCIISDVKIHMNVIFVYCQAVYGKQFIRRAKLLHAKGLSVFLTAKTI